ncbi:hypothetical protein NL676_024505 [Syzygium grande]|nr:hypothetical protein NL676_024505 [Syzygium grande]
MTRPDPTRAAAERCGGASTSLFEPPRLSSIVGISLSSNPRCCVDENFDGVVSDKGFSTGCGSDSIQKSASTYDDEKCSSRNVDYTPEIEKKYVHRVYDAIAPHFSSTRFAKWPKVATFLKTLPPGSLILDAGCGNGKYLGLNPDCYFIGCDISAPLIKICGDREHEVLVADAVNLPYRTCFGDAAISIAVLHHLSTENRRKRAIEELVRVVKKGGLVLITVWAVEQEDRSLLTKWTPLAPKYVEEWVGPGSPRVRSPSSLMLESIPETDDSSVQSMREVTVNIAAKPEKTQNLNHYGEDEALAPRQEKNIKDQQEYFDDKKGAVVYNRYYHVFGEGELERLVSGMDNIIVVDRFYDKSNWCIILEKTC